MQKFTHAVCLITTWCTQQELAKEHYDVDKFLAVFRRGPPAWLDGLTADKRGRHLIYDLATAHQNCLLLSFAIQRLLKQVWLGQ